LSAALKFAKVGCVGKYWTGVLKSCDSGVNAERMTQ